MKKLDEKLSLLRLARGFGIDPDPKLLAEIQQLKDQQQAQLQREQELRTRVRAQGNALFEAKPAEYKRPTHYPDGKPIPAALPDLYQNAKNKMVPAGQNCHNCSYMQDNGGCSRWKGAQVRANYWCAKWKKAAAKDLKEQTQSIPEQVARSIAETVVSQGEPVLVPKPQDGLSKKVDNLEKWISRIAAAGPGGGEVNLRWLDDVHRNSIGDGQYLRYDTPLKKFTFDAGFHNAFSGSWASHNNQTSNATSATAILLDVTDWQYGMSNGTNTSIMRITYPGVYNLQFSLQLVNSGNSAESAWVWLRQNGSDVAHTNTKFTVPARINANEAAANVAALNLFFQTSSTGEYVELYWWASNNSSITLRYDSSIAATASRPYLPEVPSVIVTVSPVKVDSY